MKHKKLVTALLAIFSVATLSIAASCGGNTNTSNENSLTSSPVTSSPEEEAIYEFEGLQDIKLALSATSYDFVAGVKAYKNFEETTFSVDTSAVQFGTAGEYTVTYSVGTHVETVKVYVYGEPTFTVNNATVSYLDAQSASTLKKVVTAKDTFGETLEVTVKEGITANVNGYIAYGEYDVVFETEDSVGNKAEYTTKITVSDADKPVFNTVAIDYIEIDKVTELGDVVITKIFYGDTVLTAEDYSYINGYLTFSESFILSKELGNYDLTVITDKGYNTMTLSITDNQDAKYAINVSDFAYANVLTIGKAQLVGHQQNITFEYALATADGEAVALTETDDGYTFVPGLETSFTLTVTAKRGTENAGVKEYAFTVQDDVYMWMVDRNNNADKLNYVLNEAYVHGYTTEQSYNGMGALKIEVSEGGAAQILLKNVAAIPVGSTLSFYIYNPTGIALQSYVFNNSGYWANMGLAVLTNAAEITAEPGWQKVSLTFDSRFDGTLDSMSTFAETASQAELRICNPDGWKWEGEGKFTFYMSNVYLETAHTTQGVTYNERNHQANGVVGEPVTLAYGESTDNRHTFAYEVKKGDNVVTMSTEGMSFIPQEEGEYTYTVTAYWRGKEVETKTYTINVAGVLALPTNAYYQYDANGNVTLPKASCAVSGATLVYTVTNPANETVTLGEDMVYATGNVHGTYTYKVVASKDGEEIGTETKTILIHSSNVLLGCGLSADNVNNSALSFGNPVFTFTTEEAAPGELGSMKLDNSASSEKGNFNIRLESTPIVGKSVIVVYIKYTGSEPLGLQMYSASTWLFGNYWYKGQKYEQNATGIMDYVITGSNEWQKLEIIVSRPDGAGISGNDIRLQFATSAERGYPMAEGEAPVIYLSNIYYDLPAVEPDIPVDPDPEQPTLPENVLVANGVGAEGFNGDKLNGVLGLTSTYYADESAPNETGCAKLDNSAWSEKGNFALTLNTYDLAGKSKITFYIKSTSTKAMQCKVYSGGTGNYINYWVNGQQYLDDWASYPIAGEGWIKVEVSLSNHVGTPVSGDVWLFFVTENYAWDEGVAPVIYLSNIYYDLPAVEPEPEQPTIPENVLVANGCGAELFNGDKLNGVLGLTSTYYADESAPNETGCAKLDNSAWSEKGNFALTLNTYDLAGKSKITFYIKSTSTKAMQCKVYSGGTGNYINCWVNGQQYLEDWESYPIAGEGWIKVEVSLSNHIGTSVSGDVWLFFVTEGYAWDEGVAPVIYISNIYYS